MKNWIKIIKPKNLKFGLLKIFSFFTPKKPRFVEGILNQPWSISSPSIGRF